MTTKNTTRKSVKKKVAKKAAKRKRTAKMPVSVAMVKKLAMECGTIAAASEACENLAEYISKHAELAAAWERGQFLYKLKGLSRGPITFEEAARQLGYEKEGFEELLKKDTEARDLWNMGSTQARIELGDAMMEKARAGSPAMIRQAMETLDQKQVKAELNVRRVPLAAMCEIFDVSRQTIAVRVRKNKAPRNSDDTYDLPETIKWFEQFTIDKAMREPGKYTNVQDEKTRLGNKKTALQIAEMEKRLIPADEAMAARLWTAAAITGWIDGHLEKMAMNLAGLTPQRAQMILEKEFKALREKACQLPDMYYKLLPENIAQKFAEILRELDVEKESTAWEPAAAASASV